MTKWIIRRFWNLIKALILLATAWKIILIIAVETVNRQDRIIQHDNTKSHCCNDTSESYGPWLGAFSSLTILSWLGRYRLLPVLCCVKRIHWKEFCWWGGCKRCLIRVLQRQTSGVLWPWGSSLIENIWIGHWSWLWLSAVLGELRFVFFAHP